MVVIFVSTIIPFHAFHKHLEEEHFVAVNTNKEHQNHQCKLDENFCKDQQIQHCEHKQHLAESVEKCFISQYHFLKNITLICVYYNFISIYKTHYFEQKVINVQNQFTILLNNKGPPPIPII